MLAYLKTAWLALVSVGGAVATFFLMYGRQQKKEKDRIARQYERAKEVMEQDKEIDRERDKRTEELANDLEKKRTLGELSDPNDW